MLASVRLSALLLPLLVSAACGGRAAIDDGPGCSSSDECDDGFACRAGRCRVASAPPGAAGQSPAPGLSPPACTPPGCVVGTLPPVAGSGNNGGAGASDPDGKGATGGSGVAPAGAGGGPFAGGASGGSAGAPPVRSRSFELVRTLPRATTVVSDPARNRLYVAMGPLSADFPNCIVTLSAASDAAIVGDVPADAILGFARVGPNPDRLAISDDGSTLWVGLHDASSVRKVDVSGDAPVPGAEYALPPVEYAPRPHVAGPMVLLPGSTSSLAVSMHVDDLSPSLVGVALLDEGVARPLQLPGHTGASRLTRGPSGYLLGFNNLHGGFGLYAVAVSADGLTQSEHPNLISGFTTDIVYDGAYMLFATDGSVVNVANPDDPLPQPSLPVAGPLFPDSAAGVVWVLQGAESHAYPAPLDLVVVGLPTRTLFERTTLASEVLMPRHFVRSLGATFAFIADAPSLAETGFEFESGLYVLRL